MVALSLSLSLSLSIYIYIQIEALSGNIPVEWDNDLDDSPEKSAPQAH